jgi:hypothetical protein
MAELISQLIGERDRPHTRKRSPSQSEADIVSLSRHVRKVPTTEVEQMKP